MIVIRAIVPKEGGVLMRFYDTEDRHDRYGVEKDVVSDPGDVKFLKFAMLKAFEEASREIALKRALESIEKYIKAPFHCPAGAYDTPHLYFGSIGCGGIENCPFHKECGDAAVELHDHP